MHWSIFYAWNFAIRIPFETNDLIGYKIFGGYICLRQFFFCGWLDFCWNKAHKCYKGSRLIDWDKVLALPQTLNLRRNLFEMKLLRTNRVPKCLFKFNFPFPFAVTTVTTKIIATIKVVITNRVVIQKVCYFKFKYSFKFNFPFPFAVTTVTTKIIARIIVVITNRVVIQKVCYSGKGE